MSLLKQSFQREHGLALSLVDWQPLERLWVSAAVVAVAEVEEEEASVGAVVHIIIIIITIMTVVIVGEVVVVVVVIVVEAGTRVGTVAVVIFKTQMNDL